MEGEALSDVESEEDLGVAEEDEGENAHEGDDFGEDLLDHLDEVAGGVEADHELDEGELLENEDTGGEPDAVVELEGDGSEKVEPVGDDEQVDQIVSELEVPAGTGNDLQQLEEQVQAVGEERSPH